MTNEIGNLKGITKLKGQSILNPDPRAFSMAFDMTQSTPTIILPCLKKKKKKSKIEQRKTNATYKKQTHFQNLKWRDLKKVTSEHELFNSPAQVLISHSGLTWIQSTVMKDEIKRNTSTVYFKFSILKCNMQKCGFFQHDHLQQT